MGDASSALHVHRHMIPLPARRLPRRQHRLRVGGRHNAQARAGQLGHGHAHNRATMGKRLDCESGEGLASGGHVTHAHDTASAVHGVSDVIAGLEVSGAH
jgi:hypothetical protein